MPGNACIIHIEDEYSQVKTFVSRTRDYVDLYYLEKLGQNVRTSLVELARSKDGAADEWLVYEIACPGDGDLRLRYILVGSERIPSEVIEYLFEDRNFIIDVLRPSLDQQRLWVTAEASLESARMHGGVDDRITVFTACQGSDLDALKRTNPRIAFMDKARISELNWLLSAIVARSIANG